MTPITLRVAARFQRFADDRVADLSPPLGKPGGPCQVIERIEQNVRNPALKTELTQEVGRGESLSNSDAAKVYPVHREMGAGKIKHILLTSHDQYRMDLRGVTVDDIQAALANWSKTLDKLRAMKHPSYPRMLGELNSGKVEWNDPKSGLFLVFEVRGDTAVVITTYWYGKKDPRPVPPAACAIRR